MFNFPDTSPKEFLFIMAFVVPCISIVVCYARIFYIVRKTALRSHDTGSTLGNSMHIQSNRTQNNNQCSKKIYATNNNKSLSDGTDVQLLSKSDEASGESGQHERLTACETDDTMKSKHLNVKNFLHCDNNMSTLLSHSQSHDNLKATLKCIDTNIANDFPLTQHHHDKIERKLNISNRNLSNVSISRTVEYIETNGERHNTCNHQYVVEVTQDTVDSAIEESMSSTENRKVCYLFSGFL